MLIVKLMGGLGNQLFQLFTSISYSIDNDIEYKIFEFKDDKVSPCDNKSLRGTYWNNLLKNIYNKTIRNIGGPVYQYNEPYFEYKSLPVIMDKSKNYKFFGYFQSYKYFQHNLDKILELLGFKDIIDKCNNNYDYENTVSLHFRIGDYISAQAYHPILSIDYYKNALDRLIVDTGKNDWNILYIYEENDKDMIEKNINILKEKYDRLNFIGIDHKLDDWEQMLCMSLCRHNIIANSSFSWWGAYLNNNENLVYYPEKWFGNAMGNKNLSDLFLDKWIKLSY